MANPTRNWEPQTDYVVGFQRAALSVLFTVAEITTTVYIARLANRTLLQTKTTAAEIFIRPVLNLTAKYPVILFMQFSGGVFFSIQYFRYKYVKDGKDKTLDELFGDHLVFNLIAPVTSLVPYQMANSAKYIQKMSSQAIWNIVKPLFHFLLFYQTKFMQIVLNTDKIA